MNRHISEYIRANLPKDQFPGLPNDNVVILYREGKCSFDQVLLRYHNLIASKCSQEIPGLDADDLYQDLSIKLVHCCQLWNPDKDTSFSTYFTQSCLAHIKYLFRRAYDTNIRKLNNLNTVSLEGLTAKDQDDRDESDQLPSEEPDTSGYDILIGLKLTERQEQFLYLTLDGFTKTEIADKLGLSRKRVSQIFKKIRNKIPRESLKN